MASNNTSSKRTPVYFLGIGGPSFIGDTKHPAYSKLAEVGQEITQKVQPKAVVVFSAHWQGGPSTIQINTAEETDLIYDFNGFPPHYYEYDYPNRGSKEVAEKVMQKLKAKGIDVEPVKRGLDHGVWAGFMAAFDPKKNPLNLPIVEVSIFDSEDSDQHYLVGEALQSLRDEGILIVGAGMAVHNLRDYRSIMHTNKIMPYVYTFDEVLKEAVTAAPQDRRSALSALMKQHLAREAHPTFEHILPLHIAAGAAGEDIGERLWTFPEKSLSWAQYRFGSV